MGDSLRSSSTIHRSPLSLGVCPGQYEGVQQHPLCSSPSPACAWILPRLWCKLSFSLASRLLHLAAAGTSPYGDGDPALASSVGFNTSDGSRPSSSLLHMSLELLLAVLIPSLGDRAVDEARRVDLMESKGSWASSTVCPPHRRCHCVRASSAGTVGLHTIEIHPSSCWSPRSSFSTWVLDRKLC